jgi:hypothetical protein
VTLGQSESERAIRLRAFLATATLSVVEDGATPREAVDLLDADLDRSETEDLVVLVEQATVKALREAAARLEDVDDEGGRST